MTQPITSKAPGAPEPVPVELLGDTFVRCGCGFAARSNDQFYNVQALNDHSCPHAPAKPPRPVAKWHESLFDNIFSFWGALALLVIMGIVGTLVR